MPWCPRCDEVFPDGRACPRCRARLEPSDAGRSPHSFQPVEELPQLRVPRRYRRAFERLSEPKAPSQRLLAIAAASLLFAVGFLLGRLGSPGTSQPAVHALAPAAGLAALDVTGKATYLVWSSGGERLATIAAHDLYSGEVTPLARFSAPAAGGERTQLAALGGSVALVLGGEDAAFVAAAPRHGAPFGWMPGVEAAWEAEDALLVRTEDGTVVRWSTRRHTVETLEGSWDRLLQTASGAALVSADGVVVRSAHGSRPTIDLPERAHVLAVSPDGRRALVAGAGLALWDGSNAVPVRADGYRPLGAAFSASGDRLALTMLGTDGAAAAGIVDLEGDISIKPLGTRAAAAECDATPAWEANGRWVYVASGDGAVHVVESAGGRLETVPARLVGCGLGWFR